MTARPLALDPEIPIQGLSREMYDALVDQGAFEGQRVQLIEGEIVTMAPQGWPHSHGITKLARRLDALLEAAHPGSYAVRQEKPLAATDFSEPEPDIDVVDAAALDAPAHPRTAHLVVEVADSSRRLDVAHKPRVYAAAGVPQYWVVDLVDRSVVVHEDPEPGVVPPYRRVRRLPWTQPLSVLGVSVVLSDVLA